MFSDCAEVEIDAQNFDPVVAPRHLFVIRENASLRNIARLLGLDLYIKVTK